VAHRMDLGHSGMFEMHTILTDNTVETVDSLTLSLEVCSSVTYTHNNNC